MLAALDLAQVLHAFDKHPGTVALQQRILLPVTVLPRTVTVSAFTLSVPPASTWLPSCRVP